MKLIPRLILGIGIVAGGAGMGKALIDSGPKAEEVHTEAPLTFVEVQTVELVTHHPVLSAMGLVEPLKQVVVAPEVAGRIIEQNHALVVGGRVAQGDPLVRVDARDYAAAVEAGKADLAMARLQVREEHTLRQVAEHEWRDRPEGFSEETLSFALREPHLDAARARVSSARSRIAKAKRDLGRTILRAPFDAVILSENSDLGQMVGPQTALATLAGIERFMVLVSVPVAHLPFIDIPEVNAGKAGGSPAEILGEVSSPDAKPRSGTVARLQASVDRRGRMAQVYVAVDDPLGVKVPVEQRPAPLLIGTNVRVELKGRPLERVAVVPRSALRRDRSVWVVDEDRRLRGREVQIAWEEPGTVVIASGLEPGERVVVTPLTTGTEGTKVTLDDAAGDPSPGAETYTQNLAAQPAGRDKTFADPK